MLLALVWSCNSKKVTQTEDYSQFLATSINDKDLFTDVQFWSNKLGSIPNEFPYYAKRAAAYTKLFNTTGNSDFLIEAEKDLIEVKTGTNYKKTAYLKSLAANYISQH